MNLTLTKPIKTARSFQLAARRSVSAAMVLLLSAWCIRAQEQDAAPPPDGNEPMVVEQTNDTMQAEDLISALRSLAPDEPQPGEEAAANNAPPSEPRGNEAPPGGLSQGQSYRRPSGRESRSRWSSRQRSSQSRSDYSTGSSRASAGSNTVPASLDYATFRLIVERNIFDPNRHPNQIPNHPPPPRGREPDYFTLVGTMSYDEGTFAFFSGSRSEYQKSLQRAGTIAGYKVAAIGEDSVKLALNTNQVELRIGMQMRREDDGSWSAPSVSPYTVSSFEPAPASASASTSGAVPSGPESEILKRLMEKREKE